MPYGNANLNVKSVHDANIHDITTILCLKPAIWHIVADMKRDWAEAKIKSRLEALDIGEETMLAAAAAAAAATGRTTGMSRLIEDTNISMSIHNRVVSDSLAFSFQNEQVNEVKLIPEHIRTSQGIYYHPVDQKQISRAIYTDNVEILKAVLEVPGSQGDIFSECGCAEAFSFAVEFGYAAVVHYKLEHRLVRINSKPGGQHPLGVGIDATAPPSHASPSKLWSKSRDKVQGFEGLELLLDVGYKLKSEDLEVAEAIADETPRRRKLARHNRVHRSARIWIYKEARPRLSPEELAKYLKLRVWWKFLRKEWVIWDNIW
ncbi:hypothetical protein BCR34DRAFT_605621 [Clohesyomyces aquaticus]|uniref:Uncharacterized protein n=1 Tax=Clohesyomyces aquaticus TaxID=1231657 RepID=A0A1Y1YW58_9PLEO|nr:hypothetical protein BCR34DRAFT_605621 [Clohesyomyces aquaticus]